MSGSIRYPSDGGDYQPKLDRLLARIDELLATGDSVALIGISAGGSLVTTAYALRPQLMGIITVCAPLQPGENLPAPFAKSWRSCSAFQASLAACEAATKGPAPRQLRGMFITLPLRDSLVPIPNMRLRGVRVRVIAGFNHSLAIVTALLFYRRPMVRFLRQAA